MARALSRWLVAIAALVVLPGACTTTRGDLEPRYVAVHNTLAAMGLAEVGPLHRGSLAEGREARLSLDLPAGCTTVIALGGAGVRDLDVALIEGTEPLARDTTTDPEAALRACPDTAGRYTLVVRMAAGAGEFVAATWAGSATTTAPPEKAAEPPEGDGTCASPIRLAPGTTTGNTRLGNADQSGSCTSSESRELVYRLEIKERQRVAIDVDAPFDSVVYVRKDECEDPDTEVACNDDTGGGGSRSSPRGSHLDEVLEPGTYFVFVDGYGSAGGTFRLRVGVAAVPTLEQACRHSQVMPSPTIRGELGHAVDHAEPSCGGDASGPDALHQLVVRARSRVRVTEHAADFSPVVHLRSACADARTEIGCADGGVSSGDATWTGLLDPGSYTVFADSSDRDARGRYTLAAELAPEAGSGVRNDACGGAVTLDAREPRVEGDTFRAHDDLSGQCSAAGAPDVVYRFALKRASRVSARFTAQEGEHVFEVRRSCADASSTVACAKSIDEVLGPGVYALAVDGAESGSFGRFAFTFRARDVGAQKAACRAPPALVAGRPVHATTVGAGDRFVASCAGREEAQASSDRVYKLTLPTRRRVRLSLSTPGWDGVLVLRKSCVAPAQAHSVRSAEIVCNNDFHDARHARVEVTLDAGTYYVVVDGHQGTHEGAFTLTYEIVR